MNEKEEELQVTLSLGTGCTPAFFFVVTFLLFGGDPLSPSELLVEPLETDGILLAAIGARKLERVPRLSVTVSSSSFSFIFLLRYVVDKGPMRTVPFLISKSLYNECNSKLHIAY